MRNRSDCDLRFKTVSHLGLGSKADADGAAPAAARTADMLAHVSTKTPVGVMLSVRSGEQVGRRLSRLSVGGGIRSSPSCTAYTLPGTVSRGPAITLGDAIGIGTAAEFMAASAAGAWGA